ncbi:MAG: tetratricopeptide repeat protein [Synergistaceae bacterium]|nr:tetratricopeptide repeat protein [Synergistaceae bacterium]
MTNLRLRVIVTFVLFFCALFVFAAEARANGNISADVPPAVAPMNRSVRRAPVRRAPQRTPARTDTQPVQPEPPQPSSLEMGIRMMEQERYEHARRWLQKAVQEERGNPYAWYWFGMAHDKVGQYQQAQFFFTRALELDPAFPPLSRVVAYPDDGGDRKALWDPLRPARVYPVETGDQDVVIVPPGAPESTPRPSRPYADPTLPQVPVYVPPLAPSFPGDAIQPPVYVPPDFTEQPVYIPPEPPR